MLYIKSNEEKKLVFEVDIHGCETDALEGFVRFEMYGAEYGFPVEVDDRKITAVIPPLKYVVEKDIEDGTVINARLDMVTERHYFRPWEGEVKIGAPMDIKAKIKEDNSKGPKVRSKLLTSASVKEEAVKASKTKTEGGTLDESRLERLEKAVVSLAKSIGSRDKMLSEGGGVKKEVVTEEKAIEKPKQPSPEALAERKYLIKEQLKNITEEDIIKYMTKAGTKTPKIQKIVLEQASAGAKSNLEVFKNVVKLLKKK